MDCYTDPIPRASSPQTNLDRAISESASLHYCVVIIRPKVINHVCGACSRPPFYKVTHSSCCNPLERATSRKRKLVVLLLFQFHELTQTCLTQILLNNSGCKTFENCVFMKFKTSSVHYKTTRWKHAEILKDSGVLKSVELKMPFSLIASFY